ncbi:hypothetical protein ZHAS_00012470 [Anopheles sinensis]|uniref:Uncharacterized protein n=1 Tax=Anopheles sinensis TaxID=74873 RepID=A0A084W2Z3_ANOSI|nr:hypothetical protein ZHAS_00012470 [Anopheles sinensis]
MNYSYYICAIISRTNANEQPFATEANAIDLRRKRDALSVQFRLARCLDFWEPAKASNPAQKLVTVKEWIGGSSQPRFDP